MQKIKSLLLMTMFFICGSQLQVFGQNIIWLESAFDSPRLVKTATDGSELLSMSLQTGTQPQGIAFNKTDSSLFWSELSFTGARISKAPYDFSSSSVSMDSQSVARGIAIDQNNNKIYWTTTNLISGPKIWQADLDGQSPTLLIDFGPASNSSPRSISLDINAGKMYWTNFGEGKIQRADMTIDALPEDILTDLNGPSGLAVDTDSAKIFWTEMNGNQIKSADLNGENIALLVDDLSSPNYISVNRGLNRMAWTEMGNGKVKSANLDGSDIFDYNVNALAPAGIFIETPPDTTTNPGEKLVIIPQDTTLQVNQVVQFNAQFIDSQQVHHDTTALWDFEGDILGPLTADGSLYAFFPGQTTIVAKLDTMTGLAGLSVVDTTADSSGTNEIELIQVFPTEADPEIINEGNKYILDGLTKPYDIFNGMILFFPNGSLHENISIKINLPEFAEVIGDTIEFANKVVNAINFDVFVKDTLSKPYYFDKPISVAIPFGPKILKDYNINPEDLNLFFALDSMNFDTLGISHVMVDSTTNLIYGHAEHLSTLVVHNKSSVTSNDSDKKENITPESFVLKQNYPNPFNPTTTISYQIPKHSKVELSIFNALGQKVTTLVSEKQAAGTYYVEWSANGFASGIYLYRIETDQGFVQTKKLILLK